MKIRIGTRGSKLALIQAKLVANKLKDLNISSDIIIIKTSGDQIQDKPLYEIGGKALFLKELEEALLKNYIDIAVHSMKDVPDIIHESLIIKTYLEREDKRDVLISKNGEDLLSLKHGAIIGTCAPRRMALIKAIRPDIIFKSLRGNIPTRLKKLESNEYDAIILSIAGLKRLGILKDSFHILEPTHFIPAAGQGAIGIEARKYDFEILEILSQINHVDTANYLALERGFIEKIAGSCKTPIACYSEVHNNIIYAYFMHAKDDLSNMQIIQKQYQISDIPVLYDKGVEAAIEIQNLLYG